MIFNRFAIFYTPPPDAPWARFATAWLGWNMETGQPVAHPDFKGLSVAAITATPRRYGLHGTLKPPFRLSQDASRHDLETAVDMLCANLAPVSLDGLHLTRLGRFLALCPAGDCQELNAMAARCVRELDAFRAPASEAEMTRRRAGRLSAAQDANLTRWGYPYVTDAFRFHITLTGRLPGHDLRSVEPVLARTLGPLLPAPLLMPDLALVGEAEDGWFHLIRRYALSG